MIGKNTSVFEMLGGPLTDLSPFFLSIVIKFNKEEIIIGEKKNLVGRIVRK